MTSDHKHLSQAQIAEALKDLSLRLTLHCVRNTVIEEYHGQGKLSDPEMAAFNREVVNKIYTFLQVIHNPKYEKERSFMTKLFHRPDGWDEPRIDREMAHALRIARRVGPKRAT